MKVGIIGCGWVAEKHIPFIKDISGTVISGIVDADPDKLEQISQKYKIPHQYSSLSQLLDREKVDVVHLLTPPFSHKTLAIEAIKNGVNVYIEKPIALNFNEVKEIYSEADLNGVKICPGYNYLFDPIVMEAIKQIEKPEFGKVQYVESFYGMNMRRYDRMKTTPNNEIHWSYHLPGGFHQNYITHPIYMLLRFTGKPVNIHTECNSTGALPQDLTDEIRVLVKGEKALGNLVQSYSCEPYQHYLKIYGEKEALKIDWRNLTVIRYQKSSLPDAINRVLFNNLCEASQLTFSTVSNVFKLATKRTVPYHGMKSLIELFYKCIEEDRKPPISYDLVMDTEEMCDRIYEDIPKKHLNFGRRNSTEQNIKFKETILVTGASGLVGVATVKRLVKEGYSVKAFVRKLSYIKELEHLGVEVCFGDIRHYESFLEAAKGVDIIIHLAAAMGVPATEYEGITVGGVKNLIRISRELNIAKVIYMSSMSIYDVAQCKKGQILTEDHMFERRAGERGAYTLSKLEAEKLVLKEIKNGSMNWTVFRPSMILGKNTNIFLKSIGFSLGTKIRVIFGIGNDRLRLIHVDDVAEAILLAMKNEKSNGKIYNLNHEERISKRQYIKKVIRPVKGKGLNIYVPHFLMLFVIYIQEKIFELIKRKPFLTRYRYISSQKDVIFDSAKIRNDLGWKPKKSLTELFRDMFNIV